MAATVFLFATAALVGIGVVLRRLLPGGYAVPFLQSQAE